jgi:serine/threonine-protein kinase HSL1 (negative regulator of Swe1 kinase)
MNPKIRRPTSTELPGLKLRMPDSPTKYIRSEARKVSMELGKVMEEAFNRASISSSIHTTGTGTHGYIDASQYDTPPTSFSNTRDSGGSELVTPKSKSMLSQRPLPPLPSETPNTFLQRKLAETRADIARRLDEDGDNTEHFNEVLEHLDMLMVPGVSGKRTVSAPAKSPEHLAPLHVIPEEVKGDGVDGLVTPTPHYRAFTDPIRPHVRRVVTEQPQTIRLVNESPTRVLPVAPLNIRKRSSGGLSSKTTDETTSVPWPGPAATTQLRSQQEVHKDRVTARAVDMAPTLEKQNTVIKKKRSLWFRRNVEEQIYAQENDENQVKKKQSTGLRKVPEAWQGLDDRIKNDPPTTRITNVDPSKHAQRQSDLSNASEFPMRNTSSAAAKSDGALKKGFFGLFGKRAKDEKGKNPMELGGKLLPHHVLLMSS